MKKNIGIIIKEMKEIAQLEHVDVFGTCPASKMSDETPGHRPNDLVPDAEGLVCFGLAVPKGVFSTPVYSKETIWRTQNLYYRRLDTLALRFAKILDSHGETAVPVFGCQPMDINERGSVIGHMNQIRMAEAIGLGVIGKNGLLLHSNYGSRLMLGGLVTSASLPGIRYPEIDEPGCPKDCTICVESCPVNAIMPEIKKIKITRCLKYTSRIQSFSLLKFLLLKKINNNKASRYMSLASFDEHTFHVCSRCVELCPYGNNMH